tara:strand:- start:155 stop:388 length:234 start_codon:yes stop_codon:yes gene_type:complete
MGDFLINTTETLYNYNNETDSEILNSILIHDTDKIIAVIIIAFSFGVICICISGVCRKREEIIIRNEGELLNHSYRY